MRERVCDERVFSPIVSNRMAGLSTRFLYFSCAKPYRPGVRRALTRVNFRKADNPEETRAPVRRRPAQLFPRDRLRLRCTFDNSEGTREVKQHDLVLVTHQVRDPVTRRRACYPSVRVGADRLRTTSP